MNTDFMLDVKTKLNHPGDRPRMAMRQKATLHVDPAYQRSMESVRSKKLIENIVLNFLWKRFGVIAITETGAIIDGQHRHAAAMLRPDVHAVPCLIYKITPQEAADVFVAVNRDRVNITPQAVYKAELAAGHPEATRMREAAAEAGIELITNSKSLKDLRPNETQALSTVRAQVRYRKDLCVRAMRACVSAKVILSASALYAAFRHTLTFGDDELTIRMLRQSFLKHGATPKSDEVTQSILPMIAKPNQTGETVDGVQVRRFEMGSRDGMLENTLQEHGHAIEVGGNSYRGIDARRVTLDGKSVSYATALMMANEYRARAGLPRI